MNRQQHGKIDFLDGLRGIASLQVVLWHAALFYFPALIVHPSYIRFTPIGLAFDGVIAVYLFFTLSGYVLTKAFTASERPIWALVLSRITRLGIPTICACSFGGALSGLFFHYVSGAAGIINTPEAVSSFSMWHPGNTVLDVIDDAWRMILFGYNAYAIIPFGSREITNSYNAPLWTMSVELQGSVIVLALVAISNVSRRAAVWIAVVALVITSQTFFVCFIAGHLLACFRLAERPAAPSAVAWTLIASGILLNPIAILSSFIYLKTATAILLFAGLACCSQARTALAAPASQILGRFSFPLYLAHWPIMAYLGAFILVSLYGIIGQLAVPATAAITIAIGVAASTVFLKVDYLSVIISRSIGGTARLTKFEKATGVTAPHRTA